MVDAMIRCAKLAGERQAPAFLADVRETVLLPHGSTERFDVAAKDAS